MMHEDIIRMMREAGLKLHDKNPPYAIEHFVALVAEWGAEQERESCAQVCESLRDSFLSPQYATGQPMSSIRERFAAGRCAELIRARRDAPKRFGRGVKHEY
jgi:hypothetical protein